MKYVITLLIGFIGLSAYAQDIITTKKGEDIQAKVLEITITEVKYKKYDNPDSPIYTLLKSEVLLIRYENGSKDIFNEEAPKTQTPTPFAPNHIDMSGKHFYQNGAKLKGGGLKSVLQQDMEAYKVYNQAQGLKAGEIICSVASVGCSLYFTIETFSEINRLGKENRIDEYEINWTPVIGAIALAIPAYIFKVSSRNKMEEAVGIYNINSQKRTMSLRPIVSSKGVGIVWTF